MNLRKHWTRSPKNGFSLLEILISLAVLGAIMLITTSVTNKLRTLKKTQIIVEQIQTIAKQSAVFVSKNYSTFINDLSQNVWFYPYDSSIAESNFQITTLYNQPVCIYIVKSPAGCNGSTAQCSLDAYLFFANPAGFTTTYAKVAQIAMVIGGNARVIEWQNNQLSAKRAPNLLIPQNPCGFATAALKNTILLSLTDNGSLFTQLVDGRATNSGYNDISLRRNSAIASEMTMQANLYLDNIVLESGLSPLIAESHQYRSIDFGQVALKDINNNISLPRLTMRSTAAAGASSTQSQLEIKNAGIAFGTLLATNSLNQANQATIIEGSGCAAADLGQTVQQPTNDPSGVELISQTRLQCTYNPSICSATSYCMLPLRTISTLYTFSSYKAKFTCPTASQVNSSADIASWISSSGCSPYTPATVNFTDCVVNPATEMSSCASISATCLNSSGSTLPILKATECIKLPNNLISNI